jgi:hypothetical protein
MLILTLAIGADYCRSLKKALDSKSLYAEKHGYTYIQGGEEYWDRHRPVAWSKIPFLLKYLQGKFQTFITTTHPLEMPAQHITLTPAVEEEEVEAG